MAQACGLRGVKVASVEELEKALKEAIEGQMKRGETTLVEVLLNQEPLPKAFEIARIWVRRSSASPSGGMP